MLISDRPVLLTTNAVSTRLWMAGLPEAGWVLTPEAQGRGLATEAMAVALAWADSERDWLRTFCILDPQHRASERVAEKLGYKRVGVVQWNNTETLVMDRI